MENYLKITLSLILIFPLSAAAENSSDLIIKNLYQIEGQINNRLSSSQNSCHSGKSYLTDCPLCEKLDPVFDNQDFPIWDDCSIQELTQNCGIYQNDQSFLLDSKGNQIPNLLHSPIVSGERIPEKILTEIQNSQPQRPNQEKIQKVNNIFSEIVENLSLSLKKNITPDTEGQDRRLIESIENFEIKDFIHSPNCQADPFFSEQSIEQDILIVKICPSAFYFPDSLLIYILSREVITIIPEHLKLWLKEEHRSHCPRAPSSTEHFAYSQVMRHLEKNKEYLNHPIDRSTVLAPWLAYYCLQKNSEFSSTLKSERLEQHELERNSDDLFKFISFWLNDNRYRQKLGCKEIKQLCE